ncbi:uncharacterized protein [Choristoneura fumiferana]|uniref:uncharacterized protein n=1 Tax=Choristoneura fumiferana TaxID=7141 RepID=UPI003D15856A
MSKNSKLNKGKSNDEIQTPDALAELRQLRQDLSEMKTQNNEISLLRQEVIELKEQISILSVSLTDKHAQFLTKLEQADFEIATLKSSVAHLQQQVNAQEQHSMRNELEIVGVPECDTENLTHILLTTSQIIGVQLLETDVDDIARVGPMRPRGSKLNSNDDHKPRPIRVKLLRRQKRDELLKAAKARRNLTSETIVGGAPRKLYVNERLTRENRLLFREARLRATANSFRYCWTRNGVIYVRENDNKPSSRISSLDDLEQRVGPAGPAGQDRTT